MYACLKTRSNLINHYARAARAEGGLKESFEVRYEIRVAGFGGQGIITLGYVLAKAALIHDGKYASMTQSYLTQTAS